MRYMVNDVSPQAAASTEIVLPREAGFVLGYTPSEMDILFSYGVIAHLVKSVGCVTYYYRPELLAFREQAHTDQDFASCINYLLEKDKEQ